MISIVADTNVFISAILAPYGNEYKLLRLAQQGKIRLISSELILQELKKVLHYDKFDFTEEEIAEYLFWARSISHLVNPNVSLQVVKDDPSDNKILEAAVSAKVNYLVSGDNHLLKIREYNGIKILNATSLLEQIHLS
jgi:putative PIN family toxin of toxin-antitoxin system